MLARLVAETLVFKAAELGCVGLWRRFLRPAELLPDEQLHPQPAEMADVAVNPTIFTILSLLNGPALLHRDSWTSATYVPHHIYSSSLHWRQESISGDPHGRPFVPLQPPHLTDIVYYAGAQAACDLLKTLNTFLALTLLPAGVAASLGQRSQRDSSSLALSSNCGKVLCSGQTRSHKFKGNNLEPLLSTLTERHEATLRNRVPLDDPRQQVKRGESVVIFLPVRPSSPCESSYLKGSCTRSDSHTEMNPAFLNSNSTSHTWPFSAVAELVDNASDPGVCAKQMWIDVVEEKGHLCLTFTDNGCGMTPSKLHKMLSFGFTEKGSGNLRQQAIGVYGNGFKSGSMRLGRDALIFTKNGGCQSVGMMSQTYLENIKAQAVLVPIVPFNQQTNILHGTLWRKCHENNLKAILENSIITSVEEIHAHFDSIPSKKGTKILIWNIRRTKDGKPEIDFETDVTDFRLPSIQSQDIKNGLSRSGSMRHEQDVPEMQYSLKAYLSILYLKPRTQIFLRGKRNIPRLISKGLNIIQHDVYNPHFTNDKVKVTFGMNPGKKGHYGIMLYHKNRLIKAYEKVGCQLKVGETAFHRVGSAAIRILIVVSSPSDFRLTLGALGVKLNDYCKAVMHLWAKGRVSLADGEGEEESAGAKALKWLQCRECLKWRSVPADHYEQVPESWTCSQNPNLRYRSCSVPEEAEEEPSALIYRKSHKIQDFKKRRRHISKKDHSEEDETLSQCSSEPPESVQSSNASVHSSADGEHTKESTQHSKEQTDHTGDSPLWHPSGRARAPDTEHVEEAREEKQRADRDGDACQQRTPFTRELVIKGNAHEEEPNREWDERLKDEDEDEEKHTHMESEARAQDNRDTSSNKRKAEPLFSCVNKKSCLQNQQAEAENVEEANPEKEPSIPEMSSEKTNNDRSSRVDEDGDTPERDQRGPPSLDERDRVANLQRLARLEKEVQNLRRLLGLQNSPSSPSPAQGSGDWAEFGQSALAQSVGEEPEEEEGPSRMQSSDSSFADRSSQECLRLIRANVVVLLTVVMPGLDLTNISTETSDVDSILEQVLEFNSCKLKMLPDAPK
ncbi:hypothetical protein fugu_013784 [Takifugu bimaculatus]|uniref:CW-type domain-containing protein n=1 Tax=Takifugu bimaculatus TaxID=433685 RepID=A0A4Z2C519_9TELE|nr:hypothetical protein fugu_013784 [Takifugu bimaculatus]